MSRATILGVLVLASAATALALGMNLDFRPDEPLPAATLPEAMTEAPPAPAKPLPPALGWSLAGLCAVLALLWRRGMGQAPVLALVPAACVLLHPAIAVIAATPQGCLDLAGLALLLLGAWLQSREGTFGMIAGILCLFASVILAPSGAPLAALAAFVLLERVPPMHKGAYLLLLFGIARAIRLPSALAVLPGPVGAAAAADHGAITPGPLWERFLADAGALFPVRPLLLLPPPLAPLSEGGDPFVWIGMAVTAVLILGMVLVAPERRFGGRWTALLALLALALVGVATREQAAPVAMVLAPALLLAIFCASIGDVVAERSWRRGASWLLVSLILIGWGATSVVAGRSAGSREQLLAAVVPAGAEANVPERLLLGSGRALRASASPEQLVESVRQRLDRVPPTDVAQWVADHELAIAAAIQGGAPARAAELLERTLLVADDGDLSDALRWKMRLDLADLMVRAARFDDVVLAATHWLEGDVDASVRAEILARKGVAHAGRAFQTDDQGGWNVDRRDRELAAARTSFQLALDADPDGARARVERGRLLMALGDGIGANLDLEAALASRPDGATPHLELAKLWFSRGQDEAGERHLATAQRLLGARHPEVLLVTARLQLARGDLIGAVRGAEDLRDRVHFLRGGPEELADLYLDVAIVAEDRNDLGVAEAMASLALHFGKRRDRAVESVELILRALRGQRRFPEMVELLELSEQRGWPVPELNETLAESLKNTGLGLLATDRAAAMEMFLDAIERSPELRGLGSAPGLLGSYVGETGGGSEGFAERVAEQAMRAFNLAMEQRDSDLAETERLLRISLTLLPQNPYTTYHLGTVCAELGQVDEARRLLSETVILAEAIDLPALVEGAKLARSRLDEE